MSKHQRWARATFFRVRNRNSATFKRNVAPQPQLRNSGIAIFLRSATTGLHFRNFWHIFVHGVASNYIFFFVFCYSKDFKGTVAQDIRYESGLRSIYI
jgi:hypothetical protein